MTGLNDRRKQVPMPRLYLLALPLLLLAATPGWGDGPLPCPAESLCELVDQKPVAITTPADGVLLIDYGRVAFGNVQLTFAGSGKQKLAVRFGEKLLDGRIDRAPPGSVRFSEAFATLQGGQPTVVAPPADRRNTQQGNAKRNLPPAMLTPVAWGVVTPFRWVEIEGWRGDRSPERFVRRAAFRKGWDDGVASFECSNPMLNRVWELCRYSIKATTFAGVYVDGDRERIPYEADAYLNQLGHYATDNDTRMARETFAWLERHPTWPADWTQHMVLIAHADWRHTGDASWLAAQYADLKEDVLLSWRRPDGLLVTNDRMVVDWPKTERDGFVFKHVNTVLNALHLASLEKMVEIAEAVGESADAKFYRSEFDRTHHAFQECLFDQKTGRYVDGVGADHQSLHANLFPLALGLVPEEHRPAIVDWLVERGMQCSVYAAHYLLDGLFANGAGEAAVALMTAPGDRSWRHMVDSGATITWEAWDQKYKPNLDWNHAWGAAPAHLLPRHVLGVTPLEPGWRTAAISPETAGLASARGKVPTPRGPITVDWHSNEGFVLELSVPQGVGALVDIPAGAADSRVLLNGQPVATEKREGRQRLLETVRGKARIEAR